MPVESIEATQLRQLKILVEQAVRYVPLDRHRLLPLLGGAGKSLMFRIFRKFPLLQHPDVQNANDRLRTLRSSGD